MSGSVATAEITIGEGGYPQAIGHARVNESSLIRSARRGSQAAIETLVRENWDAAYRTAYLVVQDRGVAEDVTQESFMAAIDGLRGFDRRRPFAPWLRRIVINRSLDWLRGQARRSESLLEEPRLASSNEARETWLDEGPELATAFATLQAEDRAIVVMRHLLGYRAEEIGDQLGLSGVAVRSRLSRALKHLRRDLERGREEQL